MRRYWNATQTILFILLQTYGSGSLENDPDCGTQTAPVSRIIGGKSAKEGEWPWQGVVIFDSTVGCGAGLLRDNWVVTLAQCMFTSQASKIEVVMGTNNLSVVSNNQQIKEVVEIFVHPNYVQDRYDYDIALLKTKPFEINEYVRPSCVPTKEMEPLFGNGTICVSAGFGATIEGDNMNPILQDVRVPVVDQEHCKELYSSYPAYPITENMICLGHLEGEKGVCTGDGPSVSKVEDKWYMVGIPSWYAGCASPGFPGVYIRMTAFEDWLTPIYEGHDPPKKDLECGRQTAVLEPEKFIVGGKEAQEGEWPWHAAIYVNQYFYCSASLLLPNWIVTSALCTPIINDLSAYTIRIGMTDLYKNSKAEQRRGVSAIYVHPNYTASSNDWDIALLKLSSPFKISDYVRTICVPTKDMDNFYDVGSSCTITGWGHTEEEGSNYPSLQEVELPVYNQEDCYDIYASKPITDNMFCVGYPEGGRGACTGDGGGPVVAKAGDQWYLVGLISWENGCARQGFPGVNTRIEAYVDWIQPIFTGGQPETKPSECSYEEFLCKDGWCIDYNIKCNGVNNEGCYQNTDEAFCGNHTMFFDPLFSVKLDQSSIRETLIADNTDHCAKSCLETTEYICVAFDIKNHTCSLAGKNFRVVSSKDDEILHFEIEKFPLTRNTITSHMGRIATPRWLTSSPCSAGLYVWIFKLDIPNTVTFHFTKIFHGDPATECQDPKTENFLVIKSGEDLDAPIVAQYCLNQLPETIEVFRSIIRLEFVSVNAEEYGFLAHFNGYWFCADENLDTSPGTITSPLYPANYPNNVHCTTVITAPENHYVVLIVYDFELEYDVAACLGDYDTLRVYNYNDEEKELIGVYCDVDIPLEFISAGRSLYLDFRSDASLSAKGFNTSYYFLSNVTETTTGFATTETFNPSTTDNVPETTKRLPTTEIKAHTTQQPFKEELINAELRSHIFMVATYTLLALIPVIVSVILVLVFCCKRGKSQYDVKHAHYKTESYGPPSVNNDDRVTFDGDKNVILVVHNHRTTQ